MARVKIKDRKTQIGLKALRVILGVGKGHKPSAKNVCVGSSLKGKGKYPGKTGGMRSPVVQKNFVAALDKCGFKLSPSTKAKFNV